MVRFLGVSAIAICLVACGCRSGAPREATSPPSNPVDNGPNRNLIFSPEPQGTFVMQDYDTNWPATIDAYQPFEVVDYRETISDRQDRWGNLEDQYYRRFDSVRTGRLVR